jgi:hypothetical protein
VNIRHAALAAFIAAAFASPALGADLRFSAALRGDAEPTNTGSTAAGDAAIVVHTDAQSLDVTLAVKGIRFADFWDHLEHAPMGPIHFHHYAANGEVTLLMPFPMGPSYAETKDGFTLSVKNYPYAEGAKILKSTTSFNDFVTALKTGAIVMNIHTDKFHDGEISGLVKVAP